MHRFKRQRDQLPGRRDHARRRNSAVSGQCACFSSRESSASRSAQSMDFRHLGVPRGLLLCAFAFVAPLSAEAQQARVIKRRQSRSYSPAGHAASRLRYSADRGATSNGRHLDPKRAELPALCRSVLHSRDDLHERRRHETRLWRGLDRLFRRADQRRQTSLHGACAIRLRHLRRLRRPYRRPNARSRHDSSSRRASLSPPRIPAESP